MTPYEEKLEAIAEEKNEQKQIEKHFSTIPEGMFMSNGIIYCGTCNRAMTTSISDTREECERLARHIVTLQKDKGNLTDENKKLQHKIDQLQGFLDHDIEYDIEQENLRLKKQIEKMRNCGNCEHYTWNMSNAKCQFRCESRKACDNWKMKE